MNKKLECVEEYFCSTKALYLFYLGFYSDNPEYKKYILDKNYLNGAKVSFLSNIMLSIKEDLVDSKGKRIYDSKLYFKLLEDTVETIATKVDDGYRLDNYLFSDSATLVAIVRNKLAHGKYYIDFSHNRVILLHEGNEIKVNIDNLMLFINVAFRNVIKNNKSDVCERNILIKKYRDSDVKLDNDNEIRKIIKSYQCLCFKLENIDNDIINPYCKQLLDNYIKYYKNNLDLPHINPEYKKLKDILLSHNCKLSLEIKSIKNNNDIEDVISYVNSEIKNNEDLDVATKLEIIGNEVLRRIDNNLNTFNPLFANLKNLYLLNAISYTNSIHKKDIFNYLNKTFEVDFSMRYDEFGMTLLSMFNSLYIYPFEDIFEINKEYRNNREYEFDFSKIDLSMIEIDILNINDVVLKESEQKYLKLEQKKDELTNKLTKQKNNLTKVMGDAKKETKINEGINGLQSILDNDILPKLNVALIKYQNIKDDYINNEMHFKNKAIIEGIRNSIAHGRYEIIPRPDFNDNLIVFNDIYEGNVTFRGSITFKDFAYLIHSNSETIINYVREKENCKKM